MLGSPNHPSQPLYQTLLASFEQHHSQMRSKRIWLACSGGRDSLSLAHACWQLFRQGFLPFLPQIIHINHGVQSLNAIWATHVERWCHTHDVPCHLIHLSDHFLSDHFLPNHLDSSLKTDEQSLRDARYQAMASLMNEGDVLMLGHHQDDQVETVLMRLFNGSGINGLAGMQVWHTRRVELPASRPSSVESEFIPQAETPSDLLTVRKTIHLWRPWLTMTRANLTAYAHAQHLPYVDDPSNEMTLESQDKNPAINDSLGSTAGNTIDNAIGSAIGNDRAWLRSELLPLLRQRFAQADSAIARSANLLADAKRRLLEQVRCDLTHITEPDLSIEADGQPWQSVLNIPKLKQLSAPRQSAVVHQWLTELTSKKLAPSLTTTTQILALCHREDPDHRTQIWHDGWLVCRYRQQVFALQKYWFEWLATPWQQGWQINTECIALLPSSANTGGHSQWQRQYHCQWQLSKACDAYRRQCLLAFSSSAIASVPLTPDHCRIEPYVYTLSLQLLGRAGHKSGKKLLQTLGIPAFMRPSLLVVYYRSQSNDEPILLLSPISVHVLQSTVASQLNACLQPKDVIQIHYLKR